jgi:hypothetical protein
LYLTEADHGESADEITEHVEGFFVTFEVPGAMSINVCFTGCDAM